MENDDKMVKLITTSRLLEELMLVEYPGTIFPKQCIKEGTKEMRIFTFTDLNYSILKEFLGKYPDAYNFKIIDELGRTLDNRFG